MKRTIDYSLPYPGSPAVGDKVLFDEPYDGYAGGEVVDLIDGVTGKLLAVRIAPGRTVDTYWQRCTVATYIPPEHCSNADLARARLYALDAELLRKEDASGVLRSGWWLDGIWLAPTNDPCGAMRAIEGN